MNNFSAIFLVIWLHLGNWFGRESTRRSNKNWSFLHQGACQIGRKWYKPNQCDRVNFFYTLGRRELFWVDKSYGSVFVTYIGARYWKGTRKLYMHDNFIMFTIKKQKSIVPISFYRNICMDLKMMTPDQIFAIIIFEYSTRRFVVETGRKSSLLVLFFIKEDECTSMAFLNVLGFQMKLYVPTKLSASSSYL